MYRGMGGGGGGVVGDPMMNGQKLFLRFEL